MTEDMYCDECEKEVEVEKVGLKNEVRWNCSNCGSYLGGMTFHQTLSRSEVESGFL